MELVVYFSALLSVAAAILHFQLEDCNNSPNKIVHLANAHLSKDPVHIPGPETGDVDLQILHPINGSYALNVHVQRKVLFAFIEVPCISNIGSCTYDLCDLLSGKYFDNPQHCPVEIVSSTPNFPCTCPFAAGNYHLNPTTFQIPEISGVLQWLAEGDYKVHVTVTNRLSGEEVACYNFQISTEADCSGLGCLFGRKR
ncbi:ganglioside GM2 activator-like [Mya arenaria]|uniref:ganglioside GM2 activator-like n=1 Tax=Mya arenaria TaxID=6604 RepID=UPI0022E14574|nr:ganglioside GM2 activator-like [Mya arenaria]